MSLIAFAITAAAQTPTPIDRTTVHEAELKSGESHPYLLSLKRGESAEVGIKQRGIDVVIDVIDPSGKLLETIDSPTGRNGDEAIEIIAQLDGRYTLRVRPDDNNAPAGSYRLVVNAVRNADETAAWLRARREARSSAAAWLRPRSVAIPANGIIAERERLVPLDQLAARVRVIGLGETTHGSREIGDLRLSLTRYLIQRHGYRVVAIEASADVLRQTAPYLDGATQQKPDLGRMWIGRRTRGELIEWVRNWNRAHPRDRVTVVGVDPQENPTTLKTLRAFLSQAYPAELMAKWEAAERELTAADEQTLVFGDSGISAPTRQLLLEIVAMLELDAPLLIRRFGAVDQAAALEAARRLAEFADFNSQSSGAINHSRDWYMAARVLRALDATGPKAKAIYWAHNAHVTHPPDSVLTSGALLRRTLGCDYAALAVTFGEGGFVAQLPNDPADRLLASALPAAHDETIESVLRELQPDGSLATWPCWAGKPATSLSTIPEWLNYPRPMHWIGGLFSPGTPRNLTFRSFDLLRDFDGVIYLPRVTADVIPTERPLIPARQR
jgi:erythromycin esterase